MLARLENIVRQIIFRRQVQVPVEVPVLLTSLLSGRKALVTGGTSGIGFEIARLFLLSGAQVVITGRDIKRVETAVQKMRNGLDESQSARIQGVQLDNANIGLFAEKVDEVYQRMGGMDILVNNAGVMRCSNFGATDVEEFDKIMETNLKGTYFLSQVLSRRWINEKVHGNILNICSSSSLRPGTSPYILSKWGLRSLTIGMAKQLIPFDIVVNGLAPGPTATERFVPDINQGIGWVQNPSRRLVTVQEIANLAVVLVSSLGRMVVGDVLDATGGAGVITIDDL